MPEVSIVIRTADQTRKAEVTLPDSHTGADVVQAAVDNWSLPKDTDYSLLNTRTSVAVNPTGSIGKQGIQNGDILEVQPVLVAGSF